MANYFFNTLLAWVGTFAIVAVVELYLGKHLIYSGVPTLKRKIVSKLCFALFFPLALLAARQIGFNGLDIARDLRALPLSLGESVSNAFGTYVMAINGDIPIYATLGLVIAIAWVTLSGRLYGAISNGYIRFAVKVVTTGGLYLLYAAVNYLYYLKPRTELLEGVEVIKDIDDARRSLENKTKNVASEGIQIAPGAYLTKRQECQHLLVVGTTGSGKTQLFMYWLRQIMERGDRVFIYDEKGDYSSLLGGREDVAIVSPFYEGSFAWDIAADFNSELAANEFVNALVPTDKSKDPTWEKAARKLVKGVFLSLYGEHGSDWGFKEFGEVLESKERQIAAVEKYYPSGLKGIGDINSKTTISVFLSQGDAEEKIRLLGKAWGKNHPKMSLIDWIEDEDGPKKIVIMAGKEKYGSLSDFVTTKMIDILISHVCSMTDSSSRSIWLLNDEMGDQPKLSKLAKGLAKGRSKGLRIAGAIQSFAQMDDKYGKELSTAIFGNFNNLMIGRIKTTNDASRAAKELGGTNWVAKTSVSHREDKSNLSQSVSESTQAALLDTDISSLPEASLVGGAHFWLRFGDLPVCRTKIPVVPVAHIFTRIDKAWVSERLTARYAEPNKEADQSDGELVTKAVNAELEALCAEVAGINLN